MSKNWSFTLTVADQGNIKDQKVILPLASITMHLMDLDGAALIESDEEHTYLRVSNTTHDILKTGLLTDSDGNITLFRIPTGAYNLSFRYDGMDHTYFYTKIPTQSFYFASDSTQNITVPLTSIGMQVLSYDNEAVSTALVNIASQDYSSTSHSNTTVSDGTASFRRILNGTWDVTVTKTNIYNQEARNDSSIVLQGLSSDFVIDLELTSLLVTVDDGSDPIPGANVTLYEPGLGGLKIVSSSTNGTGHHLFYHITNGTYNVTVTSGGERDSQNVSLPSSFYEHLVSLSVSYEVGDSVLIFKNETYVTGVWNDNFTFIVAFVNRTGSNPDVLITSPNWVNFTITHYGVQICEGTIGSGVSKLGDGNYSLDIRTIVIQLNSSGFPYIIKIEAYDEDFNEPDPVSFYLVISNASTTLVPDSYDISVIWGDIVEVYLFYNDTSHSPKCTDTIS